MTDKPFASTHISEVLERGRRTAVREHFGIEAFGVNAFTANVGEDIVGEHTEEDGGQEELYLVTSGRARFTVDGGEFEASPGPVVFVRSPRARRKAVASEDGTTVLAVGGPRDQAYAVAAWEFGSEFWPLYEEKDYEGAHSVLERALAADPDNANTLYNIACIESLLGRADEALERLEGALERRPSMAELAERDSDFDHVRNDPRFADLVARYSSEAAGADAARVGEGSYAQALLSDVTQQAGNENSTWLRIRKHFDVGAFGVNAYRADEAGGRVIEDHTEQTVQHQELYFVLDGRATFTLAGEELDAPAGTFIFIRDPETRRGARAAEPRTTVLAVGGRPGEPYEISAWEEFADAWPHFRAKEYDKAIEIFQRGLERHPDNANGLYNLACAESLSGDADAAVEHVTRALELNPRYRELAREDEDFVPIRQDPRFASAIAGESDSDGAGT